MVPFRSSGSARSKRALTRPPGIGVGKSDSVEAKEARVEAAKKKKVLVIGGGFGGVFAAKALEQLGRGRLDVELVNRNNYFVFQPLLPEVAASTIHSADAVVPLRQLLRGLQVRLAEVMGIDFAARP
jgi:NADPH-dependent 2,4-dienoyl-CoA reductase/sulfur reductase-like enzyme